MSELNNSLMKEKGFTRAEKWFVFFSMIVGFDISAEYAVTRPASSAIFLSVFSSHAIPWVWLISVPINFLVVCLYNRYLPRTGPVKMFGIVAAFVSGVHLCCALFLQYFPMLIFFQFICKDIYILLMYKQLWSMIHSTIASNRAKYLYGCIFGCGTLGAIAGSLIPSFCVVGIGSERLFLFTIPFNLIIYCAYRQAFQRSSLKESSFAKTLTLDPRLRESFALIRRSFLLYVALFLVVLMQISVGLMDYQFNANLEVSIIEKDLRTAYIGKMVGLTNFLSIIFQFFGGFLMIRLFGLRGSHLLIPSMLLSNAAICFMVPTFTVISASYVFLKSIDFSVFGVIREMLYIPMTLDEKFRAKAIIDVFAYRSSKALVSVCILALQFFLGSEILGIARTISIGIFACWMIMIFLMLRKLTPAFSLRNMRPQTFT